MKKYIAFLLCIIIISSLVSCDSNKEQNNTQTPNSTLTDENILEESGKNDNLTSQPSENDIAMQMYEAVLRNEVKVYDTVCEQFVYLKDCDTPYNSIPLAECERLKCAYTDMDNDVEDATSNKKIYI